MGWWTTEAKVVYDCEKGNQRAFFVGISQELSRTFLVLAEQKIAACERNTGKPCPPECGMRQLIEEARRQQERK